MYRRDGAAVIELGTARPAWQLLGDGAALALVQQVDGASELAARCVAALRERAWIGDAELADQLDGLTGAGSAPLLRPLAVDLDELAEIMDGDPATAGGAVDRESGTVWPQTVIDDGEVPDAPDVERFLWVAGGSRDGYQDMVEFIDTCSDQRFAERLGRAIRGKGAFRRFADLLHRGHEDELTRWSEFVSERRRGRARAWLADAGYRVTR